jgi:hypothetical protein
MAKQFIMLRMVGAFLGHINKDFSQGAITVFTGAEEDGLSIDLCFLRKRPTLGRQGAAFNNAGYFSFQVWCQGRTALFFELLPAILLQ